MPCAPLIGLFQVAQLAAAYALLEAEGGIDIQGFPQHGNLATLSAPPAWTSFDPECPLLRSWILIAQYFFLQSGQVLEDGNGKAVCAPRMAPPW